MIKLFFPYQRVPEWLEKQELKEHPKAKVGDLRFSCSCIVYTRQGHYNVRNIVKPGAPMVLKDAHYINIQGQSPEGCNGGVVFNAEPIINYKDLLGTIGALLCYIFIN